LQQKKPIIAKCILVMLQKVSFQQQNNALLDLLVLQPLVILIEDVSMNQLLANLLVVHLTNAIHLQTNAKLLFLIVMITMHAQLIPSLLPHVASTLLYVLLQMLVLSQLVMQEHVKTLQRIVMTVTHAQSILVIFAQVLASTLLSLVLVTAVVSELAILQPQNV